MLIFSHSIIFILLIFLSHTVHPVFIAALILVGAFFTPIYIVAGLVGYFFDVVFLTGREPFFIYQNTIIFVILVVIAQFVKKKVIR